MSVLEGFHISHSSM